MRSGSSVRSHSTLVRCAVWKRVPERSVTLCNENGRSGCGVGRSLGCSSVALGRLAAATGRVGAVDPFGWFMKKHGPEYVTHCNVSSCSEDAAMMGLASGV